MDHRNSLYASISAISSGILLSFVLHDPSSIPNIYSDIVSFWGRQWVSAGQIPYVQSFFEYPTISGLILYSARIIGASFAGYYEVFSLFSFIAAIGVAWSSWKIARKIGKNLNPVFFLMPSIIIYGIYNFDLFHILFILLSLQALLIRRRSLSGIMLALAIATKLTSVVLIPVYLLEIKGSRERVKFATITGLVYSIFNVPFILINFGNWFQTFTYLRNWGLEDAWYVWIFQNPASWDYAKYFGFGIMGILLIRI
ncbi:MAG: glycosyltransferase 87 family protein, partial [Nitrososphaerales archaeon]